MPKVFLSVGSKILVEHFHLVIVVSFLCCFFFFRKKVYVHVIIGIAFRVKDVDHCSNCML